MVGARQDAIDLPQERKSALAMGSWIGAITVGIFVSIEVVLERTVVGGNQRPVVAR